MWLYILLSLNGRSNLTNETTCQISIASLFYRPVEMVTTKFLEENQNCDEIENRIILIIVKVLCKYPESSTFKPDVLCSVSVIPLPTQKLFRLHVFHQAGPPQWV